MHFEIRTSPADVVDVALHGRLDSSGVGAIETRLTASLVPHGTHAVLDLSDVPFAGSMSIRMLLTIARTMGRQEKRLALYAVQPAVAELFRTVGFDSLVPVVEDRETAIAAVRG
jgi:anti-anti-sigma factor